MKTLIKTSLTISLILILSISNAQINDFEIWTGTKIKKKISDRVSISFLEEIRFNDNATAINKFFSDIGIVYKLNYKLRIGGYYRFIQNKEANFNYDNQHRYYFDFSYIERLDRLRITSRIRFQSKYSNVNSDDTGLIPSNYFREKITAKYDLKNSKFAPSASIELYYRLNGKYNNQFNKMRLTGGVKYNLSKKYSVELYYRLQKEFNVKYRVNSYIVGTCLSCKL